MESKIGIDARQVGQMKFDIRFISSADADLDYYCDVSAASLDSGRQMKLGGYRQLENVFPQ